MFSTSIVRVLSAALAALAFASCADGTVIGGTVDVGPDSGPEEDISGIDTGGDGSDPDGDAAVDTESDADADPVDTVDGSGDADTAVDTDPSDDADAAPDADAELDADVTPDDGPTVCADGTSDTAELCDGLDNNCDGQVDEGLDGCGLPQIAAFSAAPTYVVDDGTVTLDWQVAGADGVELLADPVEFSIGSVSLVGARDVAIRGVVTFELVATNGAGVARATRVVEGVPALQVVAPLEGVSLPGALLGAPYEFAFVTEGGLEPLTWELAEGSVAGLSLDTATGVLSGVPTAVGNTTLRVVVTDALEPAQRVERATSLQVRTSFPSIRTTSLPNGLVGAGYSGRIEGTGGSAPYSFSIASGALPTGVTLAASGTLAGAPSVAGPATFTARLTDSSGAEASAELTITVDALLDGQTRALPAAEVGVAYTQTISALGGVRPLTWSALGTLPAGLTLTTVDDEAVLSGTPTASGNFGFSLRVSDARVPTQNDVVPLNLQVLPVAPSITTTTLPDGALGVSYSAAMAGSGGTSPLTWTATGLPAGLAIASVSGTISGIPTAGGVFNPEFTLRDASGRLATRVVSIRVPGVPPVVSERVLADAVVGDAYVETLGATGGTGALTWSWVGGDLPNGIELGDDGTLSGVPTAPGTFTFNVTATDALGGFDAATFTIRVASDLAITSVLPAGTVGTPYTVNLTATGGLAPYVWRLDGSTAPDGFVVNVSSAGVLTMSPTAPGTYQLTIGVVDSAAPAQDALAVLSFTIDSAPPVILTTTLPSGTVDAAYSAPVSVVGGDGSLAWSVSAGSLPPGLTLSTGGVIEGTPTGAGTFPFDLTVVDGALRSNTQSLSITVGPAVVPVTRRQVGATWIDISASGTVLSFTGLDDASTAAPVPLGFTFLLFGQSVSEVYVHTNGFLTTAATFSPTSGSAFPSSDGVPGVIAPFWDDLYLRDYSAVYTQTVGVAPYRRFVVQYRDMGLYSDLGARLNFEVVLYETSGEVQFLYGVSTSSTSADRSWGSLATVGIESPDQVLGYTVANDLPAAIRPGRIITLTPSGAGYTATDDSRLASEFETIAATGTLLSFVSTDDGQASFTLPFSFSFHGVAQTTVNVSTNGYLTFGTDAATAYSNVTTVSADAPNNYIAAMWDDLSVTSGDVRWQVLGTAPYRRAIVQWTAVPFLGDDGSRMTFQIVLFETTNVAMARWGRMMAGSTANRQSGNSATIGIEGPGGTAGVITSADTARVSPGTAVAWVPRSDADTSAYQSTTLVSRWTDIRGGNTRLGISTVDDSSELASLGFAFPWQGTTFTQMYVSTNGYVTPNVNGSTYATATPGDGFDPLGEIVGFGDDLDFRATVDGGIFTQQRGAAPNREFVVQYDDAPLYGDTGSRLSFQLVLREDGAAWVEWGEMVRSSGTTNFGAGATAGVDGFGTTPAMIWEAYRTGSMAPGGRLSWFPL